MVQIQQVTKSFMKVATSQIFITILLTILLIGVFFYLSIPPRVKIVACDVGQGDAILVTYGQFNMLIDSGPNRAILECLNQEISPLKKGIDVAVITHWDLDHIGGFESVLQNYRVGFWLVNPTVATSQAAQNLWDQIQSQGTKIIFPVAGDDFILPGIRARLAWSELTRQLSQAGALPNQNQDSIALYWQLPSFGFFSGGDLECDQELAVAGSGLLNSVTMIKISHHGSKTGTCQGFLEKVNPEIGIISVGEGNRYGHPDSQVLKNLTESGVFLWRTDQRGQLDIILMEGDRWILEEN